MKPTALTLCGWALAALTTQGQAQGRQVGEAHAATAEDLLSVEVIGRSAIDHEGRYVVWEQAPPYSTLGDYSTPSAPPMDSGGFALWRYDREHPERRAERLIMPGSPSGLWIGSFSPDGRILAFFGRMRDAIRIGVYNLTTRRVQWFRSLPAGSFRTGRPEFAWIDNDRLAILAIASEDTPAQQNYNVSATGAAMQDAWRAAAAGKTVTATEIDSPLADRTLGPTKQIVILDSRDGSERKGVEGRFSELALSSDISRIALISTDPLGNSTSYTVVSTNDLNDIKTISSATERGQEIEAWRRRQIATLKSSASRIAVNGPDVADRAQGMRLALVDLDGAQELELTSGSAQPVRLARINAPWSNVARGQWRYVEYNVKVDATVSHLRSAAVLPPGYQPGRRYPVIVYIYPGDDQNNFGIRRIGPPETLGTSLDSQGLGLLGAQGYIIYYVSNPSVLVNTAGDALQNMPQLAEAGVKALVDQGFADPERIGLYGFSQGGYSALWLAVNPGPYRAIVSANSWADPAIQTFDLHGYYRKLFPSDLIALSMNPTRFESKGAFWIGKTPFEDPDAYVRASPLFHADRVQAPILLLHSDFDEFAIDQYERFFTALLRLNKPAKLIRYLGEAHGNTSPANLRHQWANMFAWYDRYLDVGRDGAGAIAWEGGKVRGWNGRKPFDAQQYYGLAQIFGDAPKAAVPGPGATERVRASGSGAPAQQ